MSAWPLLIPLLPVEGVAPNRPSLPVSYSILSSWFSHLLSRATFDPRCPPLSAVFSHSFLDNTSPNGAFLRIAIHLMSPSILLPRPSNRSRQSSILLMHARVARCFRPHSAAWSLISISLNGERISSSSPLKHSSFSASLCSIATCNADSKRGMHPIPSASCRTRMRLTHMKPSHRSIGLEARHVACVWCAAITSHFTDIDLLTCEH